MHIYICSQIMRRMTCIYALNCTDVSMFDGHLNSN